MNYRKKSTGIIVNYEGKILICKYSENMYGKDNRDFPGGGLLKSESYIKGLYREIYEETGIKQNHLRLIGKLEQKIIKKYNNVMKNKLIKKENKKFDGKIEQLFLLLFTGKNENINLKITNEFCKYCWIDKNKINYYIKNENKIKNAYEILEKNLTKHYHSSIFQLFKLLE